MARILTKAQLSKLESKSQAELLAIVLDLATHLPSQKHLINQYLTAEDALLALAKEYSKLTRRPLPGIIRRWMPSSIPCKISLFRCWPRDRRLSREGELFALELLANARALYEKMDTSSGSWEDYHLALVEQWLMAIAAQRESVPQRCWLVDCVTDCQTLIHRSALLACLITVMCSAPQ